MPSNTFDGSRGAIMSLNYNQDGWLDSTCVLSVSIRRGSTIPQKGDLESWYHEVKVVKQAGSCMKIRAFQVVFSIDNLALDKSVFYLPG